MYPVFFCVFDALKTFVQFAAAVVLGRISYVSTPPHGKCDIIFKCEIINALCVICN